MHFSQYTNIAIQAVKASTSLSASAFVLPFYSSISGALTTAGYMGLQYFLINKNVNLDNSTNLEKSGDILSNFDQQHLEKIHSIEDPKHREICENLYEYAKLHYGKKGAVILDYNQEPALPNHSTDFLTLSQKICNFHTSKFDLSAPEDTITIHHNLIKSAIEFGRSVEKATELLKPLVLSKIGLAHHQDPWVEASGNALSYYLLGATVFSPFVIAAPFVFLLTNQILPNQQSKLDEKWADEFMLSEDKNINYRESFKFLSLYKQMDAQRDKPKHIIPLMENKPNFYDSLFQDSSYELDRIEHLDKLQDICTHPNALSYDEFIGNYRELIAAKTSASTATTLLPE